MRLYLRVAGPVLNVDMFEIEVLENIPFTKVNKYATLCPSFHEETFMNYWFRSLLVIV